jgi:hypothetical protein
MRDVFAVLTVPAVLAGGVGLSRLASSLPAPRTCRFFFASRPLRWFCLRRRHWREFPLETDHAPELSVVAHNEIAWNEAARVGGSHGSRIG